MKKIVKGFIIAAVVLVILGIGFCVGGITAAGGLGAARDAIVGNGIHHMYNFKVDEAGIDFDYQVGNQSLEDPEGTTASEKQQYSDMERITFGKEDVKSLNMEVEEAEVEITGEYAGNEFSVQTDGDYDIYVKNGVLHIKSNGKQKSHKMLIELPGVAAGEFLLEKAEVSAAASALDIHGIRAKEFDLELSAGQVKIGELVAERAEFEIAAGEVNIINGNVHECDVSADLGDFSFTGMILKHGDVECGMGNAEFILERDVEDYNFNIECGAGNVTIGNESYSGLANEMYINNKAEETFEIECNMGNVSINTAN